MIQRKQSLYLLITGILMIVMLFAPLMKFTDGNTEFKLFAMGIKDMTNATDAYTVSTIYMGILIILSAILPLLTIFLYKKRGLQMRLCAVEFILLIGVQIYVGFYALNMSVDAVMQTHFTTVFSIIDIFPLIGIALSILAFKGIARDEALVQSVNRIR